MRTNEGADCIAGLLTSPLDASLTASGIAEQPIWMGVTQDTVVPNSADTALLGYVGYAASCTTSHTTGAGSVALIAPTISWPGAASTFAKAALFGSYVGAGVDPGTMWYAGLLARRVSITFGDQFIITFILTF